MKAPRYLRCEYGVNPLGLGEKHPRLTWELNDDRRGACQSACEVQAAASPRELAAGPYVWDSGRQVTDGGAAALIYGGAPLDSRQRVYWRVRVYDRDHQPSPWSAAACFEMGFLRREDWRGSWISARWRGSRQVSAPCPYLRREFHLAGHPAQARLYITALGIFEFRLNGQRVSADVFAPGWTDYTRRVPYRVYDVGKFLRPGQNAAGVILGDGWYAGRVGWAEREVWGDRPRLLAVLEMRGTDGAWQSLATDGSWRVAKGPLLSSDMLMGEEYDARLEMPGWDQAGFDDTDWSRATVFPDPGIELNAPLMPPVRRIQELRPLGKAISAGGGSRKGRTWIFDFGQNLAGRVRLKLQGRRGQTLTLRHGEMLDQDGQLYTKNLRSAKATDTYIMKGGAKEAYEPAFTFHGFRYVELSGCASRPSKSAVTAVVLHTDLTRTGDFRCSSPLVNQLQQNIVWGQKGNFLEVPTDCPQRDERLGWTGDAQVFAPTACFNMDVAPFFTKWQRDLADAQAENGAVPYTIPHIPRIFKLDDGGPAWADAVVICPWTIYRHYGDTRILERNFATLARYVDYLEYRSVGGIVGLPGAPGNPGVGDWLAMDAPEHDVSASPTPKELIGTAYLAHVAGLMSRMAEILGKKSAAAGYLRLREKTLRAFRHAFVTPGGRVLGHNQTSYLLALAFDLLPERQRAGALRFLTSDIERRGFHLSTGFVGTPLLAPVLTRFGRLDLAYRLLLQEDFPSWLFCVKQGATTMWERWSSYSRERGFGPPTMNSFNHYAYGAIGQWLYTCVAGLECDPEVPGFKRFRVRPRPGNPHLNPPEGLMSARIAHRSIHGLIVVSWRIRSRCFEMDLRVPPGTTARVHVPAPDPRSVLEGNGPASKAEGLKTLGYEDGAAIFEAAAGRYKFKAPWKVIPRKA